MKNLFKIAILIAMTASFIACSDTGIFYSLENEEVVLERNNLNNSTTFSNMVKIGSYYFGNAGTKIFYRKDVSDTELDDWFELALPEGVPGEDFAGDAAVTSMVEIGPDGSEDLFISRISYDGTSIVSGIFSLPHGAAVDPASVVSSDWTTQVSAVESQNDTHYSNIYRLFDTGQSTGLFVNLIRNVYGSSTDTSAEISSSQLFFCDDPVSNPINNNLSDSHASISEIDISTFVKDDDDADMVAEVENIIYDGSTNYWLIMNGESEGKLYTSPDGTTFTSVTDAPASVRYVDIYAYDATRLFLTDTAGSLHIYNGSTFRELTNSDAWLSGFADIDTLGSVTDQIIIGTVGNKSDSTNDGEGYIQLDVSSADDADWDWVDTNFSDENNYLSSELSDASVIGFLFDSATDRLFAYTAANGLWINEVDPDDNTQRIWAIE